MKFGVHFDGVPMHIVQRGHNREPCFFAEGDYSSYLHWLGEVLGEADARLTPHPLYLALRRTDTARQAAYRDLFRAQMDRVAIDDMRSALNQSQPVGNARFYARIEKVTVASREAKPRGRPRRDDDTAVSRIEGQRELRL